MAGKKNSVDIGAHCNGGLKSAPKKALEIGAQTVQIFIGSPQSWRSPTPDRDEIQEFKDEIRKNKLGPVFVHGTYLVNLASPTVANYENSIENLSIGLRLADAAGASGLIFHPGSTKGEPYEEALSRVVHSIERVLEDYQGKCRLVLEVCAGSGNTIGSKFSQFEDVFKALAFDKRLGVCFDTCHLYSAGYDIATDDGLQSTLAEFDELVGLQWLVAIHANDSKTPFGSGKDRHENIGEGSIGSKAFERMLAVKELRAVPWILEVPGFENKGPDRKNIEILRSFAAAGSKSRCRA